MGRIMKYQQYFDTADSKGGLMAHTRAGSAVSGLSAAPADLRIIKFKL